MDLPVLDINKRDASVRHTTSNTMAVGALSERQRAECDLIRCCSFCSP